MNSYRFGTPDFMYDEPLKSAKIEGKSQLYHEVVLKVSKMMSNTPLMVRMIDVTTEVVINSKL